MSESAGNFDSIGLNGYGVVQEVGAAALLTASFAVAALGSSVKNLPVGFNVGPSLLTSYAWGPSGASQCAMTRSSLQVGYDFKGGVFDSDENYIGFRFKIGADTHYGWAQLGLHSQQILAAAYNNTPNDPIMIGQIPEPSNLALLGLGVVGLGAMRRRKR